jgi:GNAT superfamily N-acetyltransferase
LTIDVTSLADAAGGDVAQVLTDALLDAPGWRDIGPERERHRRFVMWHYHRMLHRKALRWGRPGYAAFAVVFDSDGWPLPEPISTLLDVPAFVLAGLSAAVRGARAGATMKRAHFHEPHLYLWQLSIDPSAQRSWIGRGLIARVIADADAVALPVCAETAKPEVVAFCRSFGFVEIGREKLPRGAPLWLMLRPTRSSGRNVHYRAEKAERSVMPSASVRNWRAISTS